MGGLLPTLLLAMIWMYRLPEVPVVRTVQRVLPPVSRHCPHEILSLDRRMRYFCTGPPVVGAAQVTTTRPFLAGETFTLVTAPGAP